MSDIQKPPVLVELLPFVRGDTWDGISLIGPVTFNGGPPPSALASIVVNFRKAWNDFKPAYVLSTTPGQGEGLINITSTTLWSAVIPSQALPLRAGTWVWDMQFTDESGLILTPVGGSIYVAKDITHLQLT